MRIIKRLLLLLSIILLVGCSPRNETMCPIDSILLGYTDFPDGSTEDKLTSPLPEEPSRSAARYIYFGKTPAHHVVIEYPTAKRAKKRYDDYKQAIFRNSDQTLEGSSNNFQDSTADEMSYGCTQNEERKVCSFIGRYKNLVTFINIDIDDNGFSVNDFIKSVSIIEEKISTCYLEAK